MPWLPPARLTWLALLAIAVYGVGQFSGTGLTSLIVVPMATALLDLGFQRIRFPRWRFPDAALATGLFLTVLLPPMVPLPGAIAVAATAVGLRHVLRSRGRPWFNPAASGLVVGALLFGMAPAWWVALGIRGELLMVGLGLVLLLRSWRQWRLAATFFLSFGFLSVVQHVLTGAATSPGILLLTVLDPSTIFFGLFMVVEPRTAPRDPGLQPIFAGSVGLLAAFLPLALPTLGLPVSLLVGNIVTLGLRRGETSGLGRSEPRRSPTPRNARDSRRSALDPGATRWSAARRVAVGTLLLIAVGATAVAVQGSSGTTIQWISSGGGHPPSTGLSSCATDNPSIPTSTASSLHRALGPSTILSYDPSSGVTVFYDPVNQVTVTETDLYEDYGYAEFNGDDQAVAGCVP